MQRKEPKYDENGIELWLCPTCMRWLPRGSYYQDKRVWNGLKGQCRNCHIKGSIRTRNAENTRRLGRESMRRQRTKDPEKFRSRERYYQKNGRRRDIRFYARQCLNSALKGGIVTKPNECSKCSRVVKLTAHHKDYMKPLEVEWLCYEYHGNK